MQTELRNLRRKRGWMNLKVIGVQNETDDTETFLLQDADEGGRPFDYIAGQYLTFRFDGVKEKPLVRSYTMSSSPEQDGYSAVTVKRVPGGVISNWMLDNIRRNTVLKARGPIGKFCYDCTADHRHLFMVAAGSGVTPFVSIMRHHAARLGQDGSPDRMTLLVSYKSDEDLILWDDLKELREKSGVRVVVTLSRQDLRDRGFLYGRVDEVMLADVIGESYEETTFMTCGPVPLMDMVVDHCTRHGVALEHVKTEAFD